MDGVQVVENSVANENLSKAPGTINLKL